MKACPMCNGPASLECAGGVFTIRCATSCEDAPEAQAWGELAAVGLWNARVSDIEWDRLVDAEIARDEAARADESQLVALRKLLGRK